ncbi:MAG TPA: VOC family protein [Myxococcota bacterium]|nr:VOC family protein [Myxococcota bacterium]
MSDGPITRFSHVGICVSELERSLAFYRDALGFREVGRLDVVGEAPETLLRLQDVDLEAVFLERDGVRIELLHYRWPAHRGNGEPRPMNALGLTHLSLRVDDLGAVVDSLESAGARVLRATRVRNDALASDAIFVTDPDGTRIELVSSSGAKLPGG